MRRLDELRVLYGTSGQLGERLAEGRDALRLHLEATLLGHGCIPDVVGSQQGSEQRDVSEGGEAVVLGVVGGHVHHGVDV